MNKDCFVVGSTSPISMLAAAGIGFDGTPLPDHGEPITWPFSGQEFDVEIIVTGGGKWELEHTLNEKSAPAQVLEVLSEFGMGMDEPMFVRDDLPNKAGRYLAKLEFHLCDSIDWESGINDPDFGFNVISVRRLGIAGALARTPARLFELIKAPARWIVRTWPYGYLCDFHWEGQGRIRLTKGLWVIVGGETKNDSTDALPITFVSEKLVDRIAKELNGKWYMPAGAAQK